MPPAAAANIAPDSDGYVWIAQDKFRESFCQDVPADEALVMAVAQKAPVGSTFADPVTDPAWNKKPTWYQVSTEDRMIHPDSERRMAQRMNPRKTIELDASHASLASQPRLCATSSTRRSAASGKSIRAAAAWIELGRPSDPAWRVRRGEKLSAVARHADRRPAGTPGGAPRASPASADSA
jgi:hypothetical protein